MQDLENFTACQPSSLEDLLSIYPTKQQRNVRKREKKVRSMKQNT